MFKDRLKEKRQKAKQQKARAKGDFERDGNKDAPRLPSGSESEQSQSESEEAPKLVQVKKRTKTTAEQRALSLLGSKIDF